MSTQEKTHLDIFVEETKKSRLYKPSQAEIDKLNEIGRQLQIEEEGELEKTELPKVARPREISIEANI